MWKYARRDAEVTLKLYQDMENKERRARPLAWTKRSFAILFLSALILPPLYLALLVAGVWKFLLVLAGGIAFAVALVFSVETIVDWRLSVIRRRRENEQKMESLNKGDEK